MIIQLIPKEFGMLKENPLRPGVVIKVFKDFQKNQGLIGEAELIEKINEAPPFILFESFDEECQYTFKTEKWYLRYTSGSNKGIHQTRSIRYLYAEGIYLEPEEEEDISEVEDSFDLLEELGECF